MVKLIGKDYRALGIFLPNRSMNDLPRHINAQEIYIFSDLLDTFILRPARCVILNPDPVDTSYLIMMGYNVEEIYPDYTKNKCSSRILRILDKNNNDRLVLISDNYSLPKDYSHLLL